jgi:hypothetical protein
MLKIQYIYALRRSVSTFMIEEENVNGFSTKQIRAEKACCNEKE